MSTTSTTPPIPAAISAERLAAHRKSVDLSCWDSRAAQRVAKDLFQHIDHLTAKLAAASVYTPKVVTRYGRDSGPGMHELDTGEYVLHSAHLDQMAQVHTAYNLTASLLEDAKREVTTLRTALTEIASYDSDSKYGVGICPYGCDTPHIARVALGLLPSSS